MKKLLICLSVAFLFILFPLLVTASEVIQLGFDEDAGKLYFSPTAHVATTGTKYKTLGFTAKIYDCEFKIHLKQTSQEYNADHTMVTTYFEIPVYGSGNTLESRYIACCGKDVTTARNEFIYFFSHKNTILLNSIMTVSVNGVDQGKMYDDGTLTGEYYTNKPGIVHARKWLHTEDLDNYFNMYRDFDGIPVLDPPAPTAIISRANTVITSETSFKKSEAIALNGTQSIFQKYYSRRFYKWEYKSKASGSWTPLASGLNKDSPAFQKLSVGSYDVKLTVWGGTGDKEYNTITDSTQITLDILDDTTSAYVTVDPTCGQNVEVDQSQIDSNANITVRVNVTGTLYNIVDPSQVAKWYMHMRKDPSGTGDQYQLLTFTSGLGLTQSTYKDFTIPASVLKSVTTYTQSFAVKAETDLKDGKQLTSPIEYCSVTLYKGSPPAPPAPAPTNPANVNPVAVLDVPSTAKAGDTVPISGAGSYDPDGSITSYQYSTPGAQGTITGSGGPVVYMAEGAYTVGLTVLDNSGGSGQASSTIRITPPGPEAHISVSGKLKQNRITYFSTAGSTSPGYYPIDNSKTTWTISPVAGTGADSSTIYKITKVSTVPDLIEGDIYASGCLNGISNAAVGFKTPGQYDVALTVTNTAGLSDNVTMRVTIEPDLAPTGQVNTIKTVYRDTQVSGAFYARLVINDATSSPDGDYIAYRKMTAVYDANNNGVFGDAGDQTILIDESSDRTYIEANKHFEYLTPNVGMYQIQIFVREGFEP